MEEEKLKYYFNNYEHYFWQWEENGEVATIPNGQTIAYREYLIEILEALAPQGLPSFGGILLALIATNPSFSENDIFLIANSLQKNSTKNQIENWGKELDRVFDFMKLLSSFPNHYKTGTKRILVLQAIFENPHNAISAKKSKQLVNFLKNKKVNISKDAFSLRSFELDFKVVVLIAEKFPTKESILEKIASLPKLKKEDLEIDEENKQNFNQNKELDLVEELTKDKDTFVIGSLIKSLFAGLNIPFHNTQPSQQPLGGVSDLTNKGSYDRLLISEYANDDLIFLSRLANNEALFLNREVPPHQNDSERIFLIDISLKNWGTPKILAFAVAIAISSHPKSDSICHFYLIDEYRYRKIELDTVHNVIESLLFFGTGLTARKGLELFFEENTKKLDLSNKEIFYLSSTEAIQEKLIQSTLEDYKKYISYWIHTDLESENQKNTGKITVYKKKQNSKSYIQTLNLNLDKLWTNPPKKNKKSKDKNQKELYSLLLKDAGTRKLEVLKLLKDETQTSLKEAKDKIDNLPQTIKENLSLEDGKKLKAKFEELGATVQLVLQEEKNEEFDCPILFPEATNPKVKKYFSDTEFYLITAQKSLMRLTLKEKHQGYSVKKGWQRLYQNLDYRDGLTSITTNTEYEKMLFWLNIDKREVNIMNLKTKVKKQSVFVDWKWSNRRNILPYMHNFVYFLDDKNSYIFDWTGKEEDEVKIFNRKTHLEKPLKFYDDYVKNLAKIPKSSHRNVVLKNVKRVFINSENELVISKHKLILNSGQILKLEIADKKLEKKLIAEAESKNEFIFEDGSSIFIDRDGMIILKSSNTEIPTIYVPACLDCVLGVGTDEYFAGVDYFLPLDTNLEKIENQLFYVKFIQKFIQTIIEKS
ncbi:ribosomal protein L7/L12 [Bernardetia litoralis DSM 6794]|uniref:Ribosomal protein L7/L12 n=1 Tax=Bernardetia litoralis (strain ATCC 23117 / DSM 6794 / NBRC 15988 / NCIMB 1366 / Fx l1 / Sio-4) TaxID=880071 RepID=I4ANR6_BERLS|nr:ribosomal protein L7/L12 [Bernardetia litoralis]AFM05601.1 ribosomal protein L7/L12 [Bernardetia litoralis DSM 6794]